MVYHAFVIIQGPTTENEKQSVNVHSAKGETHKVF